uniref:hypothetical protein n=1 Tax=Amycolatopsis sp. CA-096443 TaxID=3239919 RepID=UPI003F49A2E5
MYLLAGVLLLAIRLKARKYKKYGWILDVLLLAPAIFSLMMAAIPWSGGKTIGGLAADVLRYLLHFLGSFANVGAPAVAAVALIIVVWFAAHDLIKDHKPDKWAKAAVWAVPILAAVATGAVAGRISEIVHTIGGLGPQLVAMFT